MQYVGHFSSSLLKWRDELWDIAKAGFVKGIQYMIWVEIQR
jgi:hypothetical protein